MELLLASDLHYNLRALDWIGQQTADVDVLVLAGDLLDISSVVPLDTQITVILEYLGRYAAATTVVACSGNHDLDATNGSGEKITSWIHEARDSGVTVDGGTTDVGGWTISSCAWWEGPESLALLEAGLDVAAARRGDRWLWAYHGPPEGPLSWTGKKHFGDPELPRLVDHYEPDAVLCGHIHEAPFVDGGAWHERRGATTLFNAGRHRGDMPSHVFLRLDTGIASWWSMQGTGETTLIGR